MNSFVGIDLGTTNSAICSYNGSETRIWKSPEQNQILFDRLVEFAHSKGITVRVKSQMHEVQGVSLGGVIEIDPSAGTKTLIHEIAHELMHRGSECPEDPAIRELEAESVAYIVAKHFGLENLNSPNYIALQGVTSKMFFSHMERIRKVTEEIISAVEYSAKTVITFFDSHI